MSGDAPAPATASRPVRPLVGWSLAAAVLLAFVAANAHLVLVATSSQPGCVAHATSPTEGAAPRAAKSSC